MFELGYAFKSINRRKKKNLGVVLAVALGVTLFIGVQVGSNAIENSYVRSYLNLAGGSDIIVDDQIYNYFPENVTDLILSSDNHNLQDIKSISTSFMMQLSYYARGQFEKGVITIGIDPTVEWGAGYYYYDLQGQIIDIVKELGNNKTIISQELANKMQLEIGDTLITSIPDEMGQSLPASYTVSNIFDETASRGTEGSFNDNRKALIHTADIQQYLIHKDFVQRLYIVLKDSLVDRSVEGMDIDNKHFKGKDIISNVIDALQDVLAENIPGVFIFSQRIDASNTIKEDMDSFKGLLNLFAYILNATALLLIINVQSMSLEDRREQTAILRALGTSRMGIFRIFLYESTIVGLVGAAFGIGFGMIYGNWIQSVINQVFGFNPDFATLELEMNQIQFAFSIGVLLSVLTAAVPSYHASGKSITNELRGISETKIQKGKGYKTFSFGLILTALGLNSAVNIGDFWKKEAWDTLSAHADILLGLGLTVAGIGFLLSEIIPRRLAMNISAFGIIGLALFDMYVAMDWVDTSMSGNGNNWLTVLLSYLSIGSIFVVVINFESIMGLVSKVLFLSKNMRGIAQTTTTNMIGKKTRLTLVISIFVVIISLNLLLSTVSMTILQSNIEQFDHRSFGVDVQVTTDFPSNATVDKIASLDTVEHVYAFRSTWMPIFFENPIENNTKMGNSYYDPDKHISFRKVIVVEKDQIMPNGKWDDDALPLTFDIVDEERYDFDAKFSNQEMLNLSKSVFADFFSNYKREKTIFYDEKGDMVKADENHVDSRTETQWMALGGFYADVGAPLYLQTKDVEHLFQPIYRATNTFDMMGDINGFAYTILITPELAELLPAFDQITEPNLFLVKSSNGYNQEKENTELAASIESALNDLDDKNSLSSELGLLVGASTKLIKEVMVEFWENEAQVWDFLNTFATLGMIVGIAGLMIIAIRSVAERTREIGMMRSIGFSRRSVVFSIIMELSFVSLIGLIIGASAGILLADLVVTNVFLSTTVFSIPDYIQYTAMILGVSFLAGLLPGYRAARVSPSQALRYTG